MNQLTRRLLFFSLLLSLPSSALTKEDKPTEEDDAMLASWRQLKRSVRGLKKDLRGEMDILKQEKITLSAQATSLQESLRIYQENLHPEAPFSLAEPGEFLPLTDLTSPSLASRSLFLTGKRPALRFEEILASREGAGSDRERLKKILSAFRAFRARALTNDSNNR